MNTKFLLLAGLLFGLAGSLFAADCSVLFGVKVCLPDRQPVAVKVFDDGHVSVVRPVSDAQFASLVREIGPELAEIFRLSVLADSGSSDLHK